ncbi:MAG: P-II family nitrogen regulator, partial [Acidimicrobiales bacterium]|nr:P-II family nitrogen regulator [Acidimicrobiales bacterium]
SRIEGHGQQKGAEQQFRGRSYKVELLPKYKIEVVCDDGKCQALIDAIVSSSRTGAVGDGKIFITDVADVVRIRTGENGSVAI